MWRFWFLCLRMQCLTELFTQLQLSQHPKYLKEFSFLDVQLSPNVSTAGCGSFSSLGSFGPCMTLLILLIMLIRYLITKRFVTKHPLHIGVITAGRNQSTGTATKLVIRLFIVKCINLLLTYQIITVSTITNAYMSAVTRPIWHAHFSFF